MPQQHEERSQRQDTIWLIQVIVFAILALAAPFRCLWVRWGNIGKCQFGYVYFAGLALIFPMFGQWPRDSTDMRIFMRSWQLMWIAAFVQRVSATLLNGRLDIHSDEIGTRGWVGWNPLWPVVIVSPIAHIFIEPVCFGLGRYLTVAPVAYLASWLIVEWKQGREAQEIRNARIAGRETQRRIRSN